MNIGKIIAKVLDWTSNEVCVSGFTSRISTFSSVEGFDRYLPGGRRFRDLLRCGC